MKTFKMNVLKTSFNRILLLAILSAGTMACQDTKSQAKADSPDMDLQTAVLYGNLEAVKQHITAGTDLDAKDPMSGSTALISATTFDKPEIAKALIDAGADLSVKNNDGSTALHAAAFFCRVEIVQQLLDAGADKSVRNNFGATARESVMGPYEEVKPIYEMMQAQLGPLGMQLNMDEVENTRPVIAMMLQ